MIRIAYHIPILLVGLASAADRGPSPRYSAAELGEALFFDVNLSANRTQACATCHAPGRAFTDPRGGAFSLGDDGVSVAARNTPTLGYVGLTPSLARQPDGSLHGGFFYDGRAPSLAEQAAEPLMNPLEMALDDAEMVRARILENDGYVDAIRALFGAAALDSAPGVMAAITSSIAAFERSPAFAPFDSKYDRFLRGEAKLTRAEERGRVLFFSNLVNCSNCHLLDRPSEETFTDYTYHNIGVPPHPSTDAVDEGLADNEAANADTDRGKFKVPTLRNVAVTGPYMHNGVFRDLRTVLVFYNTFLLRTPINPETGGPWGEAEVGENISLDLLRQGQPLDEHHLEALTAFLRALTDSRYEHLLE